MWSRFELSLGINWWITQTRNERSVSFCRKHRASPFCRGVRWPVSIKLCERSSEGAAGTTLTGRRTESSCCPQVLTRVTFWGSDFVFQKPHPWGKTPAEEERNEVMTAAWITLWFTWNPEADSACLRLWMCWQRRDLHLFSSSCRTWLMISPRSWAGTSGAWSWVCSCWPLSMIPTSSGTQWRFSSVLHAKHQILSFISCVKTPPRCIFLAFAAHLNSGFTEIVLCVLPFGKRWLGLSTHPCLFQGAGTEEACLIDILASRTNDEIKTINAFYKKREWSPAGNRIPDLGLIFPLQSSSASRLWLTSDIV